MPFRSDDSSGSADTPPSAARRAGAATAAAFGMAAQKAAYWASTFERSSDEGAAGAESVAVMVLADCEAPADVGGLIGWPILVAELPQPAAAAARPSTARTRPGRARRRAGGGAVEGVTGDLPWGQRRRQ